METPLRVVHYLNQFFGQVGGEDKADMPLLVKEGPVGPGLAVKAALGTAGEVVATMVCGDNYLSADLEGRAAEVAAVIATFKPDLLLAGPAFGAGRYGMACGAVCRAVRAHLHIPVVTALEENNPAVPLYRSWAHIVPTGPTAASMRKAVADMTKVALRLAAHEELDDGSYFSQGVRQLKRMEYSGAQRAAAMLAARLRGEDMPSEVPLIVFGAAVAAPPLANLKDALIVPITEGGLAPTGNPDRIEASMATKFGVYSLEGVDSLTPEAFQASHGGYDNAMVNADPNRLLPLDALRQLERQGEIGAVAPVFYSTAGNATTVQNASAFGKAIAADIRKRFQAQVGVFLTAT